MNFISKNIFARIAIVSSLVFTFALVSMPYKANAAADIVIASAEITSATTVVVTFADPGHDLASVDYTKWHIDVGGGGTTPLNPTSAVVTSAGTPWTITLTFPADTFEDTDSAYTAAEGLYAEGAAVTDTNSDTNIIVAHGASIEITDGQLPTFTAIRTALNTVVLTFSETVTSGGVDTDSFTVVGATAVSAGAVVGDTSITLTTTGLTSTSSTPAVNYVAATGDVTDTAGNELANGGAISATDQVPPTLVITLSDYTIGVGETATVTFDFSEQPTGFTNADVTVGNGTLSTVTVDGGDNTLYTATYTPLSNVVDDVNVITVGTSWTDSSPALNAPSGSTESANYTMDTRTSSGGGGSSSSNKNNDKDDDEDIADEEESAENDYKGCSAGMNYSITTGKSCAGYVAPDVSSFVGCDGREVGYSVTTGKSCKGNPSSVGQGQGHAYAFGTVLVKLGVRGDACSIWQSFLNSKANGNLVVDGICGPKTMAVAKAWQSSNGLVADGLLGPASRAKALSQ
ncbi:MAG: Ig-like domain-containing protein [Candidatus Paceibacterota bacterium]